MAKSPKSKTTKKKIEDAVELDVETSEAEEIISGAGDAVDAETVDGGSDTELAMDEIAPNPDAAETTDMPIEPLPQPTPERSGGFVPLLIGGVAAGAIGYSVATYFQPRDISGDLAAMIENQSGQIADLQSQLDNLPTPDTSAIEAQLSDLSDQVTGRLDDVASQIGDFQARLEEVERQPNVDGTLSETALAAYQAELDSLRRELDEQQNAVMSAASQAGADLAAAREEAERLEQDALAAAEAAVARAVINRIATAIDTGAPFADALADLGVEDVPAALTAAAETGVTTSAQLTDDFPAAARAALSTARAEGLTDDTGGIGGFLRSQFDVRSSTPQEGDGPDAILSRAEAAVKEGRVADALAEIKTLPEVARAEITGWTAQAQERADVLDAIATLSETYQ